MSINNSLATPGAFASAITCPLEVVKTNLQASGASKLGLGPMGMARKIVSESGVRGLYRGLSLSMMGIIPTRACYFWAYGDLLFFCTLVTDPRRSLSLKFSDTRVNEPEIRACLGATTVIPSSASVKPVSRFLDIPG